MPAERVAMRHAREIIRLKFSSAADARDRPASWSGAFDGAGDVEPFGERGAVLAVAGGHERRRTGGCALRQSPQQTGTSAPCRAGLAGVHREMKRKHVTLLIVWDEYIAANPGGYSYSRFCELYRAFETKLSPTMRQTHAAGERLFVDYAGDGVPVVVDRLTGEIRMAQIFVAVLGASSFTFAYASWTQALPDWIDAHVRAFEAIGGVPSSPNDLVYRADGSLYFTDPPYGLPTQGDQVQSNQGDGAPPCGRAREAARARAKLRCF